MKSQFNCVFVCIKALRKLTFYGEGLFRFENLEIFVQQNFTILETSHMSVKIRFLKILSNKCIYTNYVEFKYESHLT